MKAHFVPLVAFALAFVSPATAQTGLLVVAHGATPEWNARVRATVDQVRWAGPVTTAFLMGPEATTASFAAGVRSLADRGAVDIVVVPLMVSSFGAHTRQIRHLAGEPVPLPAELTGHEHPMPALPAIPLRVTGALDDAPELGQTLATLWSGLDSTARSRPLYLVAHGPTTDADALAWRNNIERALAGAPIGAPALDIGFLRDDAPPAIRAQAVLAMRARIGELAGRHDTVTVLPLLVSTGSINRVTIPRDLAGLPIRYQPVSLAPGADLARWIERVAAQTKVALRADR